MKKLVYAYWALILSCLPCLADSNGEFPGKGDYDAWKTASNLVDEGIELAKRNSLQQAISVYDRAARVYAFDSSVFYNRGVAQKKLGDAAGAVESFTRATTLEPGFASAWYNLGNALDSCGRLTEAERAFRQAARLDGRHFNSQFNLAVNLFKQKRYSDARDAFAVAGKLAANDQDRSDIQSYDEKINKFLPAPTVTSP